METLYKGLTFFKKGIKYTKTLSVWVRFFSIKDTNKALLKKMRGKYNTKYKDVASELGGIKGSNSMSLMRRAISIFHFADYSYLFTIRCIHETPCCM